MQVVEVTAERGERELKLGDLQVCVGVRHTSYSLVTQTDHAMQYQTHLDV